MKAKLNEDFAGLKKGSEINLEKEGKVGFYTTIKYKGSAVVLYQDSELLELEASLEERIRNINDIYKELKRTKPTIDNYLHLPEYKRERALNLQYIEDIAEVFNEGWIPDFNNRQEIKFLPYFVKNESGWVLHGVFFSDSSCTGSGFYYKTRERATLCANKFLDIYSKVLN